MVALLTLLLSPPHVLSVGPGKQFATIEAGVAAAKAGDAIDVYPSPSRYSSAHILVSKPRLTIVGIGASPVKIDGGEFEYSGVGAIPRAIFQFDPEADGCTLRNFDLGGARNKSFNGAGVRINQAKNVMVTNCEIHGNDMGIMSNGRDGDAHAAENQLIDHCRIHGNGNLKEPGYNHNLYLGGTSATVQFCDIYGSLTGHNLKSRAHFNLIRYNFIHDAANREIDLVEAWDTERPNSNAVLLGNVIVKSPHAVNRMTIHFGREKGKRVGTLFLCNNTLVTPFLGPVIGFDSPQSTVCIFNDVFANTEQANPQLIDFANGTTVNQVAANANWVSHGYALPPEMQTNLVIGAERSASPFLIAGDYRLNTSVESSRVNPVMYVDGDGQPHSAKPAYRYAGNAKWAPTNAKFIGAG